MKKLLLIFVLSLSAIACGMQTTIAQPVKSAAVPTKAQQVQPTSAQVVTTKQVTVTADILYIRDDHSTSADVIDSKVKGNIIIVGLLFETKDNPRCSGWYPVQAPNGWVCADFVK